jgi:predicted negative regulator of RcsB-dependent stress response
MADYLTDEEQAERLKEWWDKNGTSLIVGLVLAVGAVIGWRYYQSYTADRANAASEAFDSYLEARTAATSTEAFLTVLDGDHAGSAYHVFSLFYRARDQAVEEDWEEALALLERAVDVADEGVLRDTARYRAAKVLYQLDRLDDSMGRLAAVRSVGLEAQVAELSGDIAVAQGDLEAARAAYQRAVDAAQDNAGTVPGAALMELKLASLVTSDS